MSIIKAARKQYSQEEPNSLASLRQTCSVLSHDNAFIDEVMECFSIEQDENSMKMPLLVGNLKQLLADISKLDRQCEKIDVSVNLKDIYIEYVLHQMIMFCSTYTAFKTTFLSKRLKPTI